MTPAFQQQFSFRFEEFLSSKRLVTPGSHLLLAVSGGIDSMTMVHLFMQIQHRLQLTFGIVHVNHTLRGDEANGDEEFVRSYAGSLALPFFATRVDTMEHAHRLGMGKQEAARELRYQYFQDVRTRIGADAVATAHTADDNAETVLMNALRGSGIHGLAGIPLRREQGNVIRPLLFAFRDELERYARESDIAHRHDSSNDSMAYQRNRIRRIIVPMLQSNFDQDILRSLNRVSAAMQEADRNISSGVAAIYDTIVRTDGSAHTVLDIPLLFAQSPLAQDEIVLSVFRSLGIEPTAEKVSNVLDLCSSQTGRSIRLSKTVAAYRDRHRLVFALPFETSVFEFPVEIGKSYRLAPAYRSALDEGREFGFSSTFEQSAPKEFSDSASFEYIDAGQLGKKLVLRNWRDGDWFMPLGLHAKKKLSDFFTDVKVPLFEKHQIPVLESDGAIVWVCGYRLDERFRVTNKTASVAKLHYVLEQRGSAAGHAHE
jgi:tRNA(Ile)-lysidine synthase